VSFIFVSFLLFLLSKQLWILFIISECSFDFQFCVMFSSFICFEILSIIIVLPRTNLFCLVLTLAWALQFLKCLVLWLQILSCEFKILGPYIVAYDRVTFFVIKWNIVLLLLFIGSIVFPTCIPCNASCGLVSPYTLYIKFALPLFIFKFEICRYTVSYSKVIWTIKIF